MGGCEGILWGREGIWGAVRGFRSFERLREEVTWLCTLQGEGLGGIWGVRMELKGFVESGGSDLEGFLGGMDLRCWLQRGFGGRRDLGAELRRSLWHGGFRGQCGGHSWGARGAVRV